MKIPNPRWSFLLGFLVCAFLLLMALYFQFAASLEPCPLCISQRILVLAVAVVFLIGFLHDAGRVGTRVYALLSFLLALAGASVSARHVWLIHLPAEEVPACGPGLSYMFRNFPLSETLQAMVSGTGDCAKVDWTFLNLSMPAWLLLFFLGLAAGSLLQWWNVGERLPRR
jgi:disulfide bond formation protein DsbB